MCACGAALLLSVRLAFPYVMALLHTSTLCTLLASQCSFLWHAVRDCL